MFNPNDLTVGEYKVLKLLCGHNPGHATLTEETLPYAQPLCEKNLVKKNQFGLYEITFEGEKVAGQCDLVNFESVKSPTEFALEVAQAAALQDIIQGAFNDPHEYSEYGAENTQHRAKALMLAIAPNLVSNSLLRNRMYNMLSAMVYLSECRRIHKAAGTWHKESPTERDVWGTLQLRCTSGLDFVPGNLEAAVEMPAIENAYHALVGIHHGVVPPDSKEVEAAIHALSGVLNNTATVEDPSFEG